MKRIQCKPYQPQKYTRYFSALQKNPAGKVEELQGVLSWNAERTHAEIKANTPYYGEVKGYISAFHPITEVAKGKIFYNDKPILNVVHTSGRNTGTQGLSFTPAPGANPLCTPSYAVFTKW